ncbi:MAG TPA: glycosyltransferase family 1 protein [Acidiphilium sp.]
MTIWVDIEDLIGYFHACQRPSGIQRLSFDLASALIEVGEGRVRACRHGSGETGFAQLNWPECEIRLRRAMHGTRPETPAMQTGFASSGPVGKLSPLRRAARRLPPDLRRPLAAAWVAEIEAGRALKRAAIVQAHTARALRDFVVNGLTLARSRRAATQDAGKTGNPGQGAGVEGRPVPFAPGDVLLSTGAAWQFSAYEAKIDRARAHGARFALFVHDMVPLLFPEWSVKSTTEGFEVWAREVVTRAEVIFANSNATASDVANYARTEGLDIPRAIRLPLGASFPGRADATAPRLHPRPYVLFVSTLEPRKNHAGMLRVWRRLLASLPEAQVPDLVFAGRVGWMAHDVIAQAENADWFGGRIRLIEGPGDAQLATLYRDCLFTVYPSFYEGWGLPVTESLSFGKPVAASSRAAIPEAGGDFCAYFDPDDLNEACRVISDLILDPGRVAVLERRIAAQFRPPTWRDSAAALLAALDSGAVPLSATQAATALSRTG